MGQGMDIDIVSLLIGFLIGLLVFQVRGAKRVLEALGFLGTILFTLTLISYVLNNSGNLDPGYMSNTIISFIVGEVLGNLIYFVGANISRYLQFGTLSPRILIYIMWILLILIIFQRVLN